MIAVTLAVYQDESFLATGGWNRAAPILLVISGVYFVSMVLRYIPTMALRPERRWFKPWSLVPCRSWAKLLSTG